MAFKSLHGHARRAASSTRRRVSLAKPGRIEALEARELLAAGPLGLNLTSMGFVDVLKEPSADWQPIAQRTLTRDAHGWPTADASILAIDQRVNEFWNGPDPNAVQPDIGGTYHLSFHGQATVSPTWLQNYTVRNQAYNPATNVTTADLVVQHNSYAYFEIQFTNTRNRESATLAGVSDVHLIQPGYDASTTQLFADEFLAALKPVGTLRYVLPSATNQYGPLTGRDAPLEWSQRRLPDDSTQNDQSRGKLGVAWEYAVALANESDTDLWITVPGTATDDYVARLAALIRDGDTVGGVTYAGLETGRRVYVEYSNEVWGGIANTSNSNALATDREIAAGQTAVNNDGTTDWYILASRRYLERSMEVGNIFRNAFGGDPSRDRIRPVVGWQRGGYDYFMNQFKWFQSSYGAPSRYFYGMGDAIYWEPTDTSSPDAIINSLAAGEARTFESMKRLAATADLYGLKYVSYEGGPGLSGNGQAATNALAASRDPRMQGLVRQHYIDWYAAGGDLAMFFNGPYEIWSPKYGIWGAAELSQKRNPSLSPKYRGLVDVANAPTQPSTSGTPVSATSATPLSLDSDSLGTNFRAGYTGNIHIWTLNVARAGDYKLSLTTQPTYHPPGWEPGLVEVLLEDQRSLGTFAVTATGTFDLGNIPLRVGRNSLTIRTVRGGTDPSDPSGFFHYVFQPSSLTLTPVIAAPTATFAGSDAATRGDWSPAYGSDGYLVVGGQSALPAYARVTPSGQSGFTWAAAGTTADPRAPRAAAGSPARVASVWYGSTFSVDLELVDGQSHRVGLYLLDWNSTTRSQRIEVLDAGTGAVLDSRVASSFAGGAYLSWTLSGRVRLRFVNLAGSDNAVLSGLFFGPPGAGTVAGPTATATFAGSDAATRGDWSPAYGSDGYLVVGGQSALPAYARVTPSGQSGFTWAAAGTTADPRAPRAAAGSPARVASVWYGSTFSVDLELVDGQSHRVGLYLLDWNSTTRSQRIEVLDAGTGAVLDSRVASSFAGGAYLSWTLSGRVRLRFVNLAGSDNAVLSGLFFGPPGAGTVAGPTATATFAGSDAATRGDWSPAYGSDGYLVVGGQSALPAYARVTPSGQSGFTWAAAGTTADPRAPRAAAGSPARVASVWYGSTFSVDLELVDGQSHRVGLYLLDWNSTTRSQRIEVLDAGTGAVLDSRVASSFAGGAYLSWTLSGRVRLRFVNLAGSDNAVLSGLFFG